MSGPSRNRIRPDTQLQIKGHKKISTSTQKHEILYTDSQDMIVLSSVLVSRCYNCCTDDSTGTANYGHSSYTNFLVQNVRNEENTTLCQGTFMMEQNGSHTKQIVESRHTYNILTEDTTERKNLGDRDNEGRIVYKWLLHRRHSSHVET
jgi:hypothetical protein